MSQALSDLFGGPSNFNIGLQFDQWVDQFLPQVGPTVPDPLSETAKCATYLNGVRHTVLEGAKQHPLIRITDGDLNVMNTLEGELDCTVEELMEDTGKCTLTILYDNWLVDWMTHQTMPISDLNLIIDFNPTNPNWRTRWGGKITEIHVQKDDQGVHKITISALHFREHAKRLLVACNAAFPPEIQLPKMYVMPGPVRTICAITAFINLGRIFMPGWSTIDNVFNPAGWINPLSPDAVLNVLPTNWPIQIAFVDSVFDQSRWSSLGATWAVDWHNCFKDVLTDAGCIMRCYTYLTTDEDSPNTELANLLNVAPDLIAMLTGVDLSALEGGITKLVAPLRNCCVFSFEQKDGITGPTGTAADGLLSTVAITLDDLITPVVVDPTTGNAWDAGQVLNGEPVYDAAGIGETYLLQQLLDVAPAPPACIWWDGDWTGMINTDLTWHKGSAKTIMTGSKSPTIVNESISFGIRYSLAQLSAVINLWLANISGQTQMPGTPGLDNLYMGQLSDVFLAYERYTDPIRALNAGDLAWQEHFEKGSGTAYTLAGILTLRDGDWKTRAFAAFKAETLNGWPWIAMLDYQLGDRVGFEADGIVYVDNVYAIRHEWSWQQPLRVSVKIGEDKQRADPFNAAFKTMAAIYSFAGQLAGEGTIFSGG
jgi:hypothetical protein